MVIAVLDACAVIAFFRDEKGAEVVTRSLYTETCIIHAVNLAEVYLDALRRGESQDEANELVHNLVRLSVGVRTDLDPAFWKRVAQIKAQGGIAFADCFALALAERVRGKLLTADGEMRKFAESGAFEIQFIR